MNHMKKTALLALTAVALLAGCGGGGDDAPIDPRAKYVGTWKSECEETYNGRSEREFISITLVGNSDLKFESEELGYANSTCDGQNDTTDPYSNTFTYIKTKSIPTWGVVDMGIATSDEDGEEFKVISTVLDNRLYVTSDQQDDVILDDDGYPTSLLSESYLTRQ